jgi:HsdM N-terminal domain
MMAGRRWLKNSGMLPSRLLEASAVGLTPHNSVERKCVPFAHETPIAFSHYHSMNGLDKFRLLNSWYEDAPKYKEFILPLIFAKRLCDVFDDELNCIANKVGLRAKALRLVNHPAPLFTQKSGQF